MTQQRAPQGATTRELVVIAQGHTDEAPIALENLLSTNESMMRAATSRVIGAQADFDVYVQEARLAFIEAVKKFEPGRGATFTTFAYIVMQRAVARAVQRAKQVQRMIIPLVWSQSKRDGRIKEPVQTELSFEERSAVRDAVSRLPFRDRALLHHLYWNDERQQTVARMLGISQQAVSKRHQALLSGLKDTISA